MKQLILMAVGLGFCVAPVVARCPTPAFRIGQDWGTSVSISIQTRDFTLAKLTCLARTLRARDPQASRFGVMFFDSLEAARSFQGVPPEGPLPRKWQEWARRLLAVYSYDPARDGETLTLSPVGFNTAPALVTRVNLPITPQLHCKMEMMGRCLLSAMRNVAYPQDARRAGAVGRVVLAGSVDPDGSVASIRVLESASKSLANAAIRDLRSWHFDAAEHGNMVHVTYSYEIDESQPSSGYNGVEWTAPGEVRIRIH